jgi:hypothetical protein
MSSEAKELDEGRWAEQHPNPSGLPAEEAKPQPLEPEHHEPEPDE